MGEISLEVIVQAVIGLGIGLIGLGLLDVKHKLTNLSKLDMVDGIVTRLDSAVQDIQELMTDHAVSESRMKVQIDNLRERLDYLERKLDDYIQKSKD